METPSGKQIGSPWERKNMWKLTQLHQSKQSSGTDNLQDSVKLTYMKDSNVFYQLPIPWYGVQNKMHNVFSETMET